MDLDRYSASATLRLGEIHPDRITEIKAYSSTATDGVSTVYIVDWHAKTLKWLLDG